MTLDSINEGVEDKSFYDPNTNRLTGSVESKLRNSKYVPDGHSQEDQNHDSMSELKNLKSLDSVMMR
jgi:hypothetical protein